MCLVMLLLCFLCMCTNFVLKDLSSSKTTTQANQGFVFIKKGVIVEQDTLMFPNP